MTNSQSDHRARTAGKVPLHQRPWSARAFGVLGAIPAPVLGVPIAVITAASAMFLRRPRIWPPLLAAISWTGMAGAASCIVVALISGVSPSLVPAQMMAVSVVLFAFHSTVLTVDTAAILVGWLAGSSTLYLIAYGPANTRGSFENLWKYGIALTVTTAVLYVIARLSSAAWLAVVALVILGVVGTLLNFRSFGLVCITVAALIVAKFGGRRRFVWTLIFAAVAISIIAVFLPRALASGLFGEAVRAKTMAQQSSGPLLLGGRTEPPLSIAAILERPFGWGNVQAIGQETLDRGVSIAQLLGMHDQVVYLRYWVRPGGEVSLHSMLFESWVEGGVIAAIAPLLLIALFLWAAFVARGKWGPLATLVSVSSVWDLMFSPWTGARTVAIPAAAVLAAMVIVTSNRRVRDAKSDDR